MYRDKTGHVINTAPDTMLQLIECAINGDLSRENLPPIESDFPRTKETQDLIEHVHSDAFQAFDGSDKLFIALEKAAATLSLVSCQLAAGVLYEYQVEATEEGVASEA